MIFLERNVAMRVLIIYLMLLFSLSVFSVKPQQIIDSMVIKVAPWDAVTDIGIECSNFETIQLNRMSQRTRRVLKPMIPFL